MTTEEEDVETKMSGNIRPCCRASDQDEVQSEGKCRYVRSYVILKHRHRVTSQTT